MSRYTQAEISGLPFAGGGCATPAYGNYDPCPSCGVNAYREDTWNSQDSCAVYPELYTPETRCDYREKASRSIYSKGAFNYGTDGANCMYTGSITDSQTSFPWGVASGNYASYGNYIGNVDRQRKNAYQLSPNNCGYDIGEIRNEAGLCAQISGKQKDKYNNMSFVNLPTVNYKCL